MGATLPAMERLLRRDEDQPLGWLYAANTAGAMVGLLFAVFFFVPKLGLFNTSLVFAGVNAICALLAWRAWGRHVAPELAEASANARSSLERSAPLAGARGFGLRLFITGLLGIGYEVLAVRVLSQVTENTVYTYAMLLAVFLLGTALGAALLRRSGQSMDVISERIDQALGVLMWAMYFGGLSLWWADLSYALPTHWFGASTGASLAGEWLAGMAAMLAPAVAMGVLFTLLCRQAQHVGIPLGTAIGVNTLGAALAPLLVGLLLLPFAGARVRRQLQLERGS
jgi:spermidine synthase